MTPGRISPEAVLAASERAGIRDEPVTASEVAAEVGCTRRTALSKLDTLADRGTIRTKKVGARSRVWWLPDDGDAPPEPATAGLDGVPPDGGESDRLESEFREMFERISDAFYALDDDWQFTYVNDRAEELIDYRDAGLVGQDFWEVFEWATDSTLGEEYRTAMETQEPTAFEFYYPEPLEAWYEVSAYPSETGLSVYFRDITDRKRREREIEEYRSQYETLVENFPNGAVALVDPDLRYEVFGGSPESTEELTRTDLEGKGVRESLPEELADVVVPGYEAALDGESSEFEAAVGDRSYRFHFLPVRDDAGDVFAALGMSQDVTERKERERRLQRYQEYIDAVLDAIDDVFYILDESGQFRQWNDSVPAVTGYRDEEIASMSPLEFFDESDRARVAAAIREGFENGSVQIEAETVTKTGDRVPFEFVASALDSPSGDRVLAGVGRDITEQVERERKLEAAVDELEASNERLESFASMLAHELRNPVTIGQIYTRQLPDETDSTAVEYVTEAFDRIEDMIDVMLVLTRGTEAVGERVPVDLAAVARSVWDELSVPDATLTVAVDRTIRADETYVRHLFRNLFENAVEHGSTSNRPEDDDAVEHCSTGDQPSAAERDGRGVAVTVGDLQTGFYVADDGAGIPPDERDAVFEAGYTTAADGGGTGLGLAFVQELADVYGWECTATESDAGGARFEFRDVERDPPCL
ncbi:PAS domain-containing protein [Halorussus marinus]|uniref:PAS domain-containing protein n=1 Tax=Halorussus marinus TaxID=2505976 RepID=UPI00143D42B3|nr:PAS domain-containing protein [Halorussus marinus]